MKVLNANEMNVEIKKVLSAILNYEQALQKSEFFTSEMLQKSPKELWDIYYAKTKVLNKFEL